VNTPATCASTDADRARKGGDFSQTLDTNNRLISIRDPSRPAFPNNISRRTASTRTSARCSTAAAPEPARLAGRRRCGTSCARRRRKPRLNTCCASTTAERQEQLVLVRCAHSTRRRRARRSRRTGKWGFSNRQYIFSDSGLTLATRTCSARAWSTSLVRLQRATEGFPVATMRLNAYARTRWDTATGQFYPSLNPENFIPRATFGLASTGIGLAGLHVDQTASADGVGLVYSLRENLTWVKSTTRSRRFYTEFMKNHEARGGNWDGRVPVQQQQREPAQYRFRLLERAAGVFSQYTRTDRYARPSQGLHRRGYLQDTWRAKRPATIDYGLRLVWYTRGIAPTTTWRTSSEPLRPREGAAVVSPRHRERPARRFRPGHRQTLNPITRRFCPAQAMS